MKLTPDEIAIMVRALGVHQAPVEGCIRLQVGTGLPSQSQH